ncbi:NlpC/P60 family protein [Nocardia sp. NPDC048505]|uniref:NlpC/P60 family protein n=1 Tax=Nocardia sp. NPDC048505 TaxID=3155756 RepID=UPI0033C8D02B
MGGVLTAGVLTITVALGPAVADPVAMPSSASEAVQRLVELSRQSEQLNEQALNAEADLDAKLAVQRDADTVLAAKRTVLDTARDEVRKFQPVIDRTAIATYQGAKTNRMFAVLTSNSPQQLLDQMSVLDVMTTQTTDQLKQFKKATDAASAAETAARAASDAAHDAAAKSERMRSDLLDKQRELGTATTQVIEAWSGLSAKDKAAWAGSPFPAGFDRDSLLKDLVPGSGTSALAAAMTRIGDPYVWGATGPNQFDCSGLVQWAFKQVGKSVPRTSSQQANFGTPVPKDELLPGDIVFFYPEISHVGIYAGNGLMVHASTFGVPVAVAPISTTPYHSARRY